MNLLSFFVIKSELSMKKQPLSIFGIDIDENWTSGENFIHALGHWNIDLS